MGANEPPFATHVTFPSMPLDQCVYGILAVTEMPMQIKRWRMSDVNYSMMRIFAVNSPESGEDKRKFFKNFCISVPSL